MGWEYCRLRFHSWAIYSNQCCGTNLCRFHAEKFILQRNILSFLSFYFLCPIPLQCLCKSTWICLFVCFFSSFCFQFQFFVRVSWADQCNVLCMKLWMVLVCIVPNALRLCLHTSDQSSSCLIIINNKLQPFQHHPHEYTLLVVNDAAAGHGLCAHSRCWGWGYGLLHFFCWIFAKINRRNLLNLIQPYAMESLPKF